MDRDLEFSLSEALLDPTYKNVEGNKNSFFSPQLVDEPYETAREPMLLFKPPTKRKEPSSASADKKSRRKSSVEPYDKKKHQWDGVISEFFSNKKRKAMDKPQGTLYRSRSFDTLHRRLKWDDDDHLQRENPKITSKQAKPPSTFVYNPPRRRKESAFKLEGAIDKEEEQRTTNEKEDDNEPLPSVPKRDFHLADEGVGLYEEPVSILSKPTNNSPRFANKSETKTTTKQTEDQEQQEIKTKPSVEEADKPKSNPSTPKLGTRTPRGSSSPNAPEKPARSKNRGSLQAAAKEHRKSFTELDLQVPSPSSIRKVSSDVSNKGSSETGMLRVRVLGVGIRAQQQRKQGIGDPYSDDEEEPRLPVVSEIAPSDGLFCTLSVNGKQSRFETSLQPLKPREQTAVWDHTENESVFFATGQQQIFVTSRKLPLKDHKNNSLATLSQNPKAECFGVGIYPLSNLSPQKISKEDGSISDWTDVSYTVQETTVNLEPQGNVLLGLSYILLNPSSKVTCNGSLVVKFLNGVNCFRNDEPCWTCCTVDLDEENFGTTSSILGMDDLLNKGFTNDSIEFSASNNTACRIQVWGFGSDDSEYLFGETYIPLATVLPYSKHIVHQEEEGKPLKLLGDCEREIIMPLEPMGTIGVVFTMSPAPEPEEASISKETIQLLEESGIFTPAAIAHFKMNSLIEEDESLSRAEFSTIPEESSISSSSTCSEQPQQPSSSLSMKRHFIPSRLSVKRKPLDIYASGEFDHLDPRPSITTSTANPILTSLTRSLKDKRQTIRLLGNMKLQVPTTYQEKKFRQLPDDFDPYREIEILKVEMKDIKAKLADTQFYREKAELKVKNLEKEIEMWKQKFKGKKSRKYH